MPEVVFVLRWRRWSKTGGGFFKSFLNPSTPYPRQRGTVVPLLGFRPALFSFLQAGVLTRLFLYSRYYISEGEDTLR